MQFQFAGFSADSLAERLADSNTKLIVTVDGAWRGDKLLCLKKTVDEAIRKARSRFNHVVSLCVCVAHLARVTPGADLAPDECPVRSLSKLIYLLLGSGTKSDMHLLFIHFNDDSTFEVRRVPCSMLEEKTAAVISSRILFFVSYRFTIGHQLVCRLATIWPKVDRDPNGEFLVKDCARIHLAFCQRTYIMNV